MFEKNDVIGEAVNVVYALTDRLNRGDILPHMKITEVLGLQPHEGAWQHILNRVRARLQRERGIATWFEKGVGYRLLTVRETLVDLPRWRRRKARSQFRRLIRSQAALPDAELTVHERQIRQDQIHHDRAENRRLLAEIKAVEAFMSQPERIAQRPIFEPSKPKGKPSLLTLMAGQTPATR